MTAEHFESNSANWLKLVRAGTKTADALIKTLGSKHMLSEEQQSAIRAFQAPVDDFVRDMDSAHEDQ